jgi:hypothetical protein
MDIQDAARKLADNVIDKYEDAADLVPDLFMETAESELPVDQSSEYFAFMAAFTGQMQQWAAREFATHYAAVEAGER